MVILMPMTNPVNEIQACSWKQLTGHSSFSNVLTNQTMSSHMVKRKVRVSKCTDGYGSW